MRIAAELLVLLWAGCSDNHSSAVDLAVGRSPIGGACSANADCLEGPTPTCWDVNYLDHNGAPLTPGGYCSSPCQVDADCQSGACIDEGADGKWCFSHCAQPADCRSGYACFTRLGGHCFPSSGLDCDPTVGDGTCPKGGCVRRALGTGPGMTGACLDGCSPGAGSCPPANNVSRQCVVISSDKFKGPVCVTAYSSNVDPCHMIDDCVDGDECFLSTLPSGDNRCHRLCRAGTACASGACVDVFGLFGSATPVGLCL